MGYKLPLAQLKELLRLVLQDANGGQPAVGNDILREIAAEGWAHSWRVEDLLLMTDRRLNGYQTSLDLAVLGRSLGLPLRSACVRPASRSSSVSLSDAWEAIDAAALFIVLEMLSFAIDPAPLVAALRPRISKKGYISSAALDLLWYEKRKGKGSITFEREDTRGSLRGYEDHALRAGYKLVVLADREGEPVSLTFKGPKYRKPREPIETVCKQCGVTWYRGDPDSSASHRRTHRQRMAVLDPEPNELVLAEMARGIFTEHVDWRSPEWRHREMSTRASAFRREEGYDFTQWDMPERDPEAHGFMFTNDDGRIVGVCAFRLRQGTAGEKRWGLQFVWVAPPYRRQGVLRTRWQGFRERFGAFEIEGPVSEAMMAFAHALGDAELL